MNVAKEYKAVNAILTRFGEDPIAVPSDGTDRQKIEFLLNTYAESLKQAVPNYRNLKDNRLIPEIVVQHLVSILEGKK